MIPFVLTAEAVASGAARHAFGDDARSGDVLYLANDSTLFKAVATQLPSALRLQTVGQELARTARQIASDIVNLDASVLPKGSFPQWWRASNLGDRGPYATQLLPRLAKAVLVLERLKRGQILAVIVDTDAFARALATTAQRNGMRLRHVDPRIGGKRFQAGLDRVRKTASVCRAILSELSQGLARVTALRRFRKRRPFPRDAIRKADVMLCSWTDTATFASDQSHDHERYLGGIPGILSRTEKRLAYLVLPISWVEPFEEILESTAASPDCIVFPEDFFSYFDIFQSLVVPFNIVRGLQRRLMLNGFDLSDILALEIQAELTTMAASSAARFARVATGLAKTQPRLQAVMSPYENQPWEKVLRSGLRASLPSLRWVSYFHPPSREMYLSFLPSSRDVETNEIPDELVVLGKTAAAFFTKGGFPKERLSIGGAVRYDKVTAAIKTHEISNPPDRGPTVLCATTIEHFASTELVLKTAQALMLLGNGRMIVNFHPTADRNFRAAIKRSLSALSSTDVDIQFSTERISALVEKSDVVVYNNSASCIEALAAGRMTIFVHRDSDIDFDCLPEKLTHRCRTSEEIAECLRAMRDGQLQPLSPADIKSGLADLLGPVEPEVFVRAVFGGAGSDAQGKEL